METIKTLSKEEETKKKSSPLSVHSRLPVALVDKASQIKKRSPFVLEIHYKWEIANLLHSISEVLSSVSILLKQTVTSLMAMKTDSTFL